jgi:hypothetical protein
MNEVSAVTKAQSERRKLGKMAKQVAMKLKPID